MIFSKLFGLETIHIQILAYCEIIPACSLPRWHNCYGEREGLYPVNRFNHTIWVAIVIPVDRPKSVRNRCVIEVWWRFCVVTLPLGVFCGCRGLCYETESDLFLFPFLWLFMTFAQDQGQSLHKAKILVNFFFSIFPAKLIWILFQPNSMTCH